MVGYGWVKGVTQSKSRDTEVSPRLGDGVTGTFSQMGISQENAIDNLLPGQSSFFCCLFVLFWIWFCYGICDLRQGTVPVSRPCFSLQMRGLHLLGGPSGVL